MIKDIYILGGEGFIGMNLAEYFGPSKKYKIHLISKSKSIFSLSKGINIEKKYENIYNCTFNIKRCSIVIHLARSTFSTLEEFKSNELKLKEYINLSNPKKIIVFSSSVIYTSGKSLYKDEKTVFEEVWKNASLIVRLFNVYGKYQLPNRQGSLIATIFYNYLKGKITNINDTNQIRNFIYAGDIGKVLEKLIDNNIVGIVDIGNKTITIKELLYEIGKIIDLDSVKLLYNKEVIFKKEPNNKIELNYTGLQVGLKETYEFQQKN